MKEVEELYGKMLAVFEEKTGFTMDDTADLAVSYTHLTLPTKRIV